MYTIPTYGPNVPTRIHESDAGFDLLAAEDVDIAPGSRALISTGMCIAIPRGLCGLVLSRSGLAAKHGVVVLNAPGLIDSGYRGEVKVVLANLGLKTDIVRDPAGYAHEVNVEPFFNVHVGDRIAQLVIVRHENAHFSSAPEHVWEMIVDESDRGVAGIGSTGR